MLCSTSPKRFPVISAAAILAATCAIALAPAHAAAATPGTDNTNQGQFDPGKDRRLPPPPDIDHPDVTLELLGCLDDADGDKLESGIESARKPPLDARRACRANREIVGVWTLASGAVHPDVAAVDRARDRGLAASDLPDVGFGAMRVSAKLIQRSAKALKSYYLAHRFNDDLEEDDKNGKIHVRNLTVSFASGNRVITKVKGYKEVPGPNVSFETTITDTISLVGFGADALKCTSSMHTNLKESKFWLLAALNGPHWMLEAIYIGAVKEPDLNRKPSRRGAGCTIVDELLPREIPFEGQRKLVFGYNEALPLEVAGGSILAPFGSITKQARVPAADIAGRTSIDLRAHPGSTFTYQALPDDLLFSRGSIEEDLDVSWTASAGARISKPTLTKTNVTFDTANIPVGGSKSYTLRVRIADLDGMSATATRTVTLFRPAGPRPNPRGDFDPNRF